MPTRQPAALLILLTISALLACGDSDTTPNETSECRLNSDCPAEQVCEGEVCVDSDACTGSDCPCLSDSDCGAAERCEASSGECLALECLGDSGCALGELCESGVCATDVEADRDRDGVPDTEDLCPEAQNADQEDLDGDGLGDACDLDDDNDGAPDSLDNCPADANITQADANSDGIGNACDEAVPGATVLGSLDGSQGGNPDPTQARVFLSGRAEAIIPDDAGAFRFEHSLAIPGPFSVRVEWTGFLPFERLFEAPDDQAEIDLGALVMSAEANDPEGATNMGGRVALQGRGEADGVVIQALIGGVPVGSAISDEDGRFGLRASRVDHTLKLSREGFAARQVEVIWRAQAERFEIDGEALAETVLEMTPIPFDGRIEVNITVEDDWLPEGEARLVLTVVGEGLTDLRQVEDGDRVVFDGLAAGNYNTTLTRVGFEAVIDSAALSQAAPSAQIALTTHLVDLSAARMDLSGATFDRTDVEGVSMVGADLSRTALAGQDLSGLDLRRADLSGADLSRADLTEVRLDGARLDVADLSGARMVCVSAEGASFLSATLHEVDLSGSTLRVARFDAANLIDATLDGPTEGCEPPEPSPARRAEDIVLTRADLSGATLSGLNLTGVALDQAILRGTALDGAVLDGATMVFSDLRQLDAEGASLLGATMIGAIASGANFAAASLNGALLNDALLDETDFTEASLIGATLSGAILERATLTGAVLDLSDLSRASAVEADFTEASLFEASAPGSTFARTTLDGADLSYIDMTSGRLDEATLVGASLPYALMSGLAGRRADLDGANLQRANLSGASLGISSFVGADLSRANLRGTLLINALVSNTDFSRSALMGANLTGAVTIQGRNFAPQTRHFDKTAFDPSTVWPLGFDPAALTEAIRLLPGTPGEPPGQQPDLSGVDLSGMVLASGNLNFINWAGADFHGAELRDTQVGFALFPGVDLSMADLRTRDFSFTDFSGANLFGTRFLEDINGLDNNSFGDTVCPDGDLRNNCAPVLNPPRAIIEDPGETHTFAGQLNDNDPQWRRLSEDCTPHNDDAHFFRAFFVTHEGQGPRQLTITANWANGDDGFLHILAGAANPQEGTGCIAGDDDFGGVGQSQIEGLIIEPGQTIGILASTFAANATLGRYTIDVLVER